jgi:signal transduction histidine kinase
VTEWLQGQQISVLAIAAACVALFVLTSARMFGLGREATAQEERGRLLDHTLRATEEERTRIASDLHDGPVQEIVALAYKVSRARRKLAQQDLESADELVAKVERVLEEQIAAVRRVMADLRPSVLDTRGLEAALRDLASTFESEAGVRTVVEVALDERLPTELETVLFRAAQESLTNIRKHARAGQVTIVLGFDHANATLAVTDDGVGFDTSTAKKLLREGHFGLAGMRERAALIGGQLELRSQPGQGTTVEVSLPVERELVTV